MKKLILFSFNFILSNSIQSQAFENKISNVNESESRNEPEEIHKSATGRVNIFIFTRERNNKIDLLAFYTLLRARVKSLFHHRKFYVINARSSKDATAKVERILRKKKKLIKNIWFDSHGHYGNRYSSFRIGTDQFSIRIFMTANAINYLRIIAKYCDENTKWD